MPNSLQNCTSLRLKSPQKNASPEPRRTGAARSDDGVPRGLAHRVVLEAGAVEEVPHDRAAGHGPEVPARPYFARLKRTLKKRGR